MYRKPTAIRRKPKLTRSEWFPVFNSAGRITREEEQIESRYWYGAQPVRTRYPYRIARIRRRRAGQLDLLVDAMLVHPDDFEIGR